MRSIKKTSRLFNYLAIHLLWLYSAGASTRRAAKYYSSRGMIINGIPNYLSAKIWFDGTDLSLIELNEGCTISSNVLVLTHDWSANTVARELGIRNIKPAGTKRRV